MNQRHQKLADQVLTAFRSDLDQADQQRIGEARFQTLHGLICEALCDELELASSRVEAVLKELRAEIDKPELEL
jgi:hypothetical protein